MEELQARHRKEQRELQGKVTSKKKNATKKTRKGVNDECDRLERELQEKQQLEIAALASSVSPSDFDQDISHLSNGDDPGLDGSRPAPDNIIDFNTPVKIEEAQVATGQHGSSQVESNGGKKPNRQKARLARRAAEQEAQMKAAAEEAADMPDQREQELAAMQAAMKKHGLVETMIRPDGHCLYSACVKTIPSLDQRSYKDVRVAAASYIRAHPDDFVPFLEESLDLYTHKIQDTAEWGGHLELQAISKAYQVNINVLQASGHVEQIQPEEPSEKTAWLAYYRHSFGLGEHYNALTPTTQD